MARNVADIFNEAREMPADKREAYLLGACGKDAALRAEVESLLRADSRVGGFMARPTGDDGEGSMLSMHFEAASDVAPSEQAGKQIGPYKLLEKIGEGGFGTVWMAEQREPVRRRVAIKLIKLGMDTKQVIARFEAERQALAMMDHPNIAKVLDAGSTEAGRPYFVMEYIRGIPILEYCDQELLDTKARLALFTDVCHAIQHAHHKGIIHRDIKPSNVLVTMHDGVPVPKVIDFGIAKATNSELTTKTLFTEHRQMIGTPAYMSPEQAEMSALDIDTRSDIYSLGVLLYELLTGTTPFDVYDLRVKGYEEMLRIIREDEPHKPSTRVSTLGEDGAQAAKHRRAHDPKRLSGLLRGDLDWIVMKCLEKDRTRRYETPNGLAADVQRHLKNEPVTAGAPSTAYKLRKFVRRNRGKVVAASLVAGTLVLGVIGTTGGMLWANSERDRAGVAKQQADLAAASESVAKVAAQQSAEKARVAATRATTAKEEEAAARKRAEAISEFMVTALRSSDAQNAGGRQDMTILAAMDSAIADLDSGRFKDDPATEAALKGAIGHILHNNGRWQVAEVLLRQALESERRLGKGDSTDLSRVMNNLALVLQDLGRNEEARLLFAQALEMNQRLFPGDNEAVAKGLQNLGGAVSPKESVELRRQSLEMRRRLFRGDSDAVAHSLMNLAYGLQALGRTGEAEPLFAEAVEMSRRVFEGDHPFLPIALCNLGKARFELGRQAEGVEMLTEAVAMQRRLFKPPHPHLARGIHNLAWVLKEQGRVLEAERLFVEALEMRDRCVKEDTWDTSSTLNCLGGLLLAQGRLTEAEPLLIRALDMRRRLAPGDHPEVAESLMRLAKLRLDQRQAETESLHGQALAMQRRLHPGDHADVALALQNLAVMLRDTGRPAEAEPIQMQAVEMYQRLFPGDNRQVSLALYTLADVRDEAGRVAEAVAPIEAALEIDRRLLPANHKDLLADLEKLARVYNLNRRYEKATPLYEEASKGYEATLGRQDPLTLHLIGNLGANYVGVGRAAEAVPLLEEAWKNAKKYPKLGQFGPFLLNAYVAVADPAKEGSTERAMALLDELLASSRATLTKESPELAQELNSKSMRLIDLKAWDAAERLLREALAIREKVQPDMWTTFNTKSILGGALLGQKKYAQAEPLLLAGYRGMKEREATIGPDERRAVNTVRIPQALERLVKLYEAMGNVAEAAAWKSTLEAARMAESKPAAPGDK